MRGIHFEGMSPALVPAAIVGGTVLSYVVAMIRTYVTFVEFRLLHWAGIMRS